MYDISDNDNDNVYSAHIVVYISGHEISIFSISEVFITFNTSRKNVTCFYVQWFLSIILSARSSPQIK